jgi:hypothetical protein
MQRECPHPVDFKDNCPTKCAFAGCDRATYQVTDDPDLLFDPSVDRSAAIKDGCTYCGFFLTNGPRIAAK